MTADRDGYRNLYPEILRYSDLDFENLLNLAQNKKSYEDYKNILDLKEDVSYIHLDFPISDWPNEEIIPIIREYAEIIFLIRGYELSSLDDAEQYLNVILGDTREERINAAHSIPISLITPEEIEKFNLDWKTYISISHQRSIKSQSIQDPFDMIDYQIRNKFNVFPMVQDLLNKTHNLISRGHNWFGVGELSVAYKNYLHSLGIAIATNNIVAVESIVRFLVDTYIASEKYESAKNLANDYLLSFSHEHEIMTPVSEQISNAVSLGCALSNLWDESIIWLKKAKSLSYNKTRSEVDKWRIVKLLNDLYNYQGDNKKIEHLRKIIKVLSAHQQNLY